VAFATMLSAAFIMAANSWMQHPVGYTINNSTHRAELTDIWALFTNPVFGWSYLHVILASLTTGALLMLAVSAWHLRRDREVDAFRLSATIALAVLVPAITLGMFVGDELGVIEGRYQPMKIAAAEAQWSTCQPCSFSLFQIGGGNNDETPTQIIAVPHMLSVLATNSWNGQVQGLNPLNSQYETKYGAGYYVPNVFIQYWSMRVMAYTAGLVFLFGLWGIWLLQRRKLEHAKWFLRLAVWGFLAPIVINTAGWLLTESGRQPWIVQGLMLTKNGVSPNITTTDIAISLTVFVLIYAILGVAEGVLMVRYARRDLEPEQSTPDEGGGPVEGAPETGDERIPELVY
jgi:cytochrome d ubiquinol oxidase subunit I